MVGNAAERRRFITSGTQTALVVLLAMTILAMPFIGIFKSKKSTPFVLTTTHGTNYSTVLDLRVEPPFSCITTRQKLLAKIPKVVGFILPPWDLG